ncbi:hypothetical protein, partial [Escherichia coli]|uniref:hypothetical protein n=1 Tax=Escherichia coli TaxID=562 RepID=UPI002FDF3DE1
AEPSRKKSGVPFRVPIFILDGSTANTLPDGGGFPQGAIPHVRTVLTYILIYNSILFYYSFNFKPLAYYSPCKENNTTIKIYREKEILNSRTYYL